MISITEAYALRDRLAYVRQSIELDKASGLPPHKLDVESLLKIADDAIIELMLECEC